ncbi:hypothetical protein [Lactiplantibacillus fabifermentans]|uniref:Uncharacterized protein n=1 Tax=Lactiplantibacillus fabifermentans DSM 21115 TaxID=1413187 RepID=A0A0R2NL18_9LACO|nr:hypothetical protein [Lactiplantibacillus fabifermentans]KRO26470.1 hypothetical protein DY78_GL000935 [Lactiplantibacillus fabifermentans DSM 21115]
MGLLLTILGGLLVIGLGYLGWRLRQQQRAIIDFQLTYHKTMTPAQIQHSRRFFFKTEIKKSAGYRRLNLGVQVGRWGSYAFIVAILAQQFGILDADDMAVMATLLWLGLFATLTLRNGCQWWLNRQLYASVAVADTPAHVDLMMTPQSLTQAFLHYQIWGIGTLGTLLVVLAIASGTAVLPADYFANGFNGFLFQSATRSTTTYMRSSTTSSESATTADNDTTTDNETNGTDATSDSSSAPKSKAEKAYDSAAYVRSLPVKTKNYLNTQDRVGMISMYYLALNHYPANGISNNPGTKYAFHIIKNMKPLTIVVTSSGYNDKKFLYLTQIDDQERVRIFKFKNQTPTALNGLVPEYTEYPNSQVKMGQLINGYYSEEDGPYHRTMWAMEPGTLWTK